MGGKGTAQVATGIGGRRWKGIGSDSERWEAEGRQRQRRGKVRCGGTAQAATVSGGKQQAAARRGGRQGEGTGSDSKRWEVKGKHRQ